jgi:hypothetical protein
VKRREIFGAVAALIASVAAAQEAKGPRIRVEPESFDFGKVRPRRTLRKEFRLLNLGDEALVIERISKSCGCTEATAEVSTLEPGGSTPLRVTMETRASAGPVENYVLIRSNDRSQPALQVLLRATVVAE